MDDEISMYSETESDEAMGIYVEQLEEKVEYYKVKCNNVYIANIKLYVEVEILKKTKRKSKSVVIN